MDSGRRAGKAGGVGLSFGMFFSCRGTSICGLARGLLCCVDCRQLTKGCQNKTASFEGQASEPNAKHRARRVEMPSGEPPTRPYKAYSLLCLAALDIAQRTALLAGVAVFANACSRFLPFLAVSYRGAGSGAEAESQRWRGFQAISKAESLPFAGNCRPISFFGKRQDFNEIDGGYSVVKRRMKSEVQTREAEATICSRLETLP